MIDIYSIFFVIIVSNIDNYVYYIQGIKYLFLEMFICRVQKLVCEYIKVYFFMDIYIIFFYMYVYINMCV